MSFFDSFGRLLRSMRGIREQPDAGKLTDPGRSVEPQLHRSYDALSPDPGVSPGEACDDAVMIARVLQSYKLSVETEMVKPSAIWEMIFDTRLLPLHQTLLSGDVKAASALLRRPGDSDLFYGFDALCIGMVKDFQASKAIEYGHAKLCQDHLVRVAEAVGALRIENPEWPDPSRCTAPNRRMISSPQLRIGSVAKYVFQIRILRNSGSKQNEASLDIGPFMQSTRHGASAKSYDVRRIRECLSWAPGLVGQLIMPGRWE
jgi:hypothetical protein